MQTHSIGAGSACRCASARRAKDRVARRVILVETLELHLQQQQQQYLPLRSASGRFALRPKCHYGAAGNLSLKHFPSN
eukprot:6287420-Amphidinium_carterae.1